MKEKIYSTEIANTIKSYLEENDWYFSFDENTGMFKFSISLNNKIKSISYIIDIKKDEYIVYAFSPVGADYEDEYMMSNMTEFIRLANYGLKNGNFELDSDGELRFKSYVDCDGIIPGNNIIRNSIFCPITMFDYYGAGIVDIIFGNTTAKEAVEKCERATEEEPHSLLSELIEYEDEYDLDKILSEIAENWDSKDDDESSDIDCIPPTFSTNCNDTKGDED